MAMEFYARVADIGPRANNFIREIFDGGCGLIEPAWGKGDAVEAVGGLEELLAVDGFD